MPSKPQAPARTARPEPVPFLELRIGGLHLTVQQLSPRLLALGTAVLGSLGGAFWIGH